MIRIGILGAGRVVENRYVEVFRDELRGSKIVMVCDKKLQLAQKAANQLGAKAVTKKEEMLESKEIDLILVATESGKHSRHVRAVLAAGKHVIVEKPPAMIPDEILEDEALAKEKGLMYAVIFQNRLNPAMEILKQTYDKGRFGRLVLATIRLRWCRYQDYYEDGWHGSWKMDGGVINQQAIHHIDALQWVCGDVDQVCAQQSRALNHLEAEDTTVGLVKFENGALGAIEATTAARPEDFEASISIVGEKGIVVIGGIALNKIDTWQFTEKITEDEIIPEKYSQDVPTGYGLSHGPLLQKIVNRLEQGRIDPPISGRDSVPTVRLVHALYKSNEAQKWVRMSDHPLSDKLGRG
jgi:UDP-N-acetyl-2-amino-2-deoxyglucuronate dehydrogenase